MGASLEQRLSAGCVTRPMRANMIPYQGINILILWSAALEKGFSAPIWMTFKQAAASGRTCPKR